MYSFLKGIWLVFFKFLINQHKIILSTTKSKEKKQCFKVIDHYQDCWVTPGKVKCHYVLSKYCRNSVNNWQFQSSKMKLHVFSVACWKYFKVYLHTMVLQSPRVISTKQNSCLSSQKPVAENKWQYINTIFGFLLSKQVCFQFVSKFYHLARTVLFVLNEAGVVFNWRRGCWSVHKCTLKYYSNS